VASLTLIVWPVMWPASGRRGKSKLRPSSRCRAARPAGSRRRCRRRYPSRAASACRPKAAPDQTRAKFRPIGSLVNRAGVAPFVKFQETEEDLFDTVIHRDIANVVLSVTDVCLELSTAYSDAVDRGWLDVEFCQSNFRAA
jgi:hypothetical protein